MAPRGFPNRKIRFAEIRSASVTMNVKRRRKSFANLGDRIGDIGRWAVVVEWKVCGRGVFSRSMWKPPASLLRNCVSVFQGVCGREKLLTFNEYNRASKRSTKRELSTVDWYATICLPSWLLAIIMDVSTVKKREEWPRECGNDDAFADVCSASLWSIYKNSDDHLEEFFIFPHKVFFSHLNART